jgi:hypothetical protein
VLGPNCLQQGAEAQQVIGRPLAGLLGAVLVVRWVHMFGRRGSWELWGIIVHHVKG